VVEHLLCKPETLSSNPDPTKKKKKKAGVVPEALSWVLSMKEKEH
jgi:hypothetical protein